MADKPSKEEDNRKDRDDEDDQEKTFSNEYSEDTKQLLKAGDRKKSKEELSAGTSKPSTPKKGDKSGAVGGKLHLFKRSEKEAKHGKAEDKPSPSKKTTRKASIVGSEVRTMFGTFCEFSEQPVDYALQNQPKTCEELRRVESGGTVQSFLSEDDSSVTSEPYAPSRHTTGVVFQTVVREEGGEKRIEQKVVPLVELPQYPVVAVGTGLLAATSGLLAASVSIPALAADELSGASSVVATGGAIPKEIGSSGEKLDLGEGASPAKKSKKVILSPELIDEKLQETSGFQRSESTRANSPIPMSPKLQGLESGGSESSVQLPQIALESIHIEPDSPFEMTDPTCSKDEESVPAEPKGKESVPAEPKGKESVPAEPKGKESVPAEPKGKESVPAEPKGKESVPAEPKGKESVPAEPKGKESVPAEPKGKESVPAEPKGKESVPAEPKGKESVPAEPKGKESVPAEPKGKESVPAEPKGKESVPAEPKGKESVPAEPKGKESVPAEPKGKESVPAEPKGKESVQAEPKDEKESE